MSTKQGLITAFIVVLGCTQGVNAQSGGFAGSALRIGFGARAMGMSNAMTATTSQGSFAHYNPAIAASDRADTEFNLGVSSLRFDRIYQTAGAHFQLPPKAGLSFELIRSGVKNIDGRTASGYPVGEFDTSEYQLLGAFGIRLSERLKMGLGFKLNYLNLHKELKPATTVGLDFGLLYQGNGGVTLGIAVQDLLAEYRFNSGDLYGLDQTIDISNKFPTRFKVGISYEPENTLTFSADYEIMVLKSEYFYGGIAPLAYGFPTRNVYAKTVTYNNRMVRLGAAWDAHERLTVRAGYNLPDSSDGNSWGFSGGFSIKLPFDTFSPSIDYAFVGEPYRIAYMHVFALSLHL